MENKKSRVVIMGCESYDNELVYEKLKSAVELLGGIEQFVNRQERILLKPNLLRGKHLMLALPHIRQYLKQSYDYSKRRTIIAFSMVIHQALALPLVLPKKVDSLR